MIIRDLYRYRGENGTVDSLVKLPMDFEPMKRITAEEGNLLSNGEVSTKELDIPACDLDKWSEIPDPDYVPDETTGE